MRQTSESSLSAQPRLTGRRNLARDLFDLALLVLLTFTPINLVTARAIVEGPSMQPTFYTGDLVIVNRAIYFFSAPQRGDVIVLHNPRSAQGDDLIKRVIGLPNETVELRDGRVYINGLLLEEPYIREFCGLGCNGKWTLSATQYFVLGDNRAQSYDSHNFGPIEQHLIVGQAWIRYWPLSSFTIIEHPSYALAKP
ncbi:MAG: signal peptidase I [Candidatus Thermofonsia Clade 1 bacterium]|jgi:signal peptidase I|uniref:Signal peptidase I n=1 Tax=Candidatus Thermofonsia Clade 1 bacterium TaxID=2364210 RepID=A0A2M8PH80_9CHLR|nr:MAG: signal peptidase I [Candidatus Thermofonsia Clade 1 bacterium]RMF53735.1 MAG: signal peptidase I [Chloroflexota bacterium]